MAVGQVSFKNQKTVSSLFIHSVPALICGLVSPVTWDDVENS